jgi:septal ring factor EnvC (AmiA/AmiB activator)
METKLNNESEQRQQETLVMQPEMIMKELKRLSELANICRTENTQPELSSMIAELDSTLQELCDSDICERLKLAEKIIYDWSQYGSTNRLFARVSEYENKYKPKN